MTIDVETLLVRLEATQTKFEKQLANSYRTADRRSNQIERRFTRMNRNLQRSTSNAALSVNRALGTIGVGLGVREVAAYADAWTTAGNKLRAAAQSSGVQTRSLDALKDGANEARTGLEEYVDLYARLIRSASGVAESELEIAQATSIVSKAFKAGGATAREQASGILQLGQALGSGVLQGDELRSLRESAPIIAKAIADEFKTTVAGLKQLGAEGKLTSERVFRAIISAQADIEAQFEKTNSTITDAITRINNEFTSYIGNADQANGASAKLVEALQYLADNFSTVADTVVSFATVLIGAFAGKAIVGTVLGLGRAVVALGVFLTAVKTGTLVMASFTAVLGPIGLLAGGAAAAIYLLSNANDDAGRSIGQHESAIVALNAKLGDNVDLSAKSRKAVLNEADAHLKAAKATLQNAQAKLKLREQEAAVVNRSAPDGFFLDGSINDPFSSDTGTNILREGANNSLDRAAREFDEARKDYDGALEAIEKLKASLGEGVSTPDNSGFGNATSSSSGSGKSGKNFESSLDRVRERIALIKAETAAQATLNPLVDDYGYAVERAKIQQQLLASAKRNNIQITPELSATIDELAGAYANATVESKRLSESQQTLQRRAQELKDTEKDALKGFIQDIKAGTSASDALANALDKVADKLLDIAFENYNGNFLSSLFGFFGFGSTSVGAPTNLLPYSDGGYTGPGGKYEPKGVVHGGEFVFSKQRVQQLGLGNLERLHRGYANGGLVGRMSSSPPTGAGYGSNSPIALHVHATQKNEFNGHKSADMIAIEDQQRERDLNFKSNVVTAVREAIADRALQSNDF